MTVAVATLPPADEDDCTEVVGKLRAPTTIQVEAVGRWYEAFCLRRRAKHSLSYHSLQSSSSEDEVCDDSGEEDENEAQLMQLDPKDWKNQDHYMVLGLSKLRYRATEDQIKRAYKKKVLVHHPDKRRAKGLPVKDGEDDYFTCITRAWETLGVPAKRRSYDSVDPDFDDAVPPVSDANKANFFGVFGPALERNLRWSNKRTHPKIGDDNSTYDEVNHFYSFWYDFDSWREYSYLDEEEKEKGENRDERRWIEKQNKAARQKRKKEELARIRQLVDNAYSCDPRILRFKEEKKEQKLAQKRAKQEAAQQKAEEEKRLQQEAQEAERKRKEKEEEEAKAKAAAAKKEKDAQKKILKKERKSFRTALKDYDYFATDDAERVTNMADVDKLAELLSIASLQSLNEDVTSGDKDRACKAFTAKVAEINAQMEEEKRKLMEASQAGKQGGSSGSEGGGKSWSDHETQLLIKAVNLFPAGTVNRWETVANFINQHSPGSRRSAKESLGKAKDLQKMDPNLKDEVNKKAFDKFEKEKKGAPTSAEPADHISERYISVAEQQVAETGTNPAPWTAEEQKFLEQALKTYPSSVPDRWEKIASVIPTRSKKDCMKRYKELVELVRAKKAAADAAAKGKK